MLIPGVLLQPVSKGPFQILSLQRVQVAYSIQKLLAYYMRTYCVPTRLPASKTALQDLGTF